LTVVSPHLLGQLPPESVTKSAKATSALWGVGQVVPLWRIDLETMIRAHGSLNALAFAVPGAIAGTLDRAPKRSRLPIVLAAP
jgi:hypothetical protein